MKEIIKKTEKERELGESLLKMTVKQTGYFYFACDTCNVAFFGDDSILSSSRGGKKCPLMIRKTFLKKEHRCENSIYGGDENCFNKYYKIK